MLIKEFLRVIGRAIFRSPLEKAGKNPPLKGLKNRVKVEFDQWGIPHILAENNDDLFIALGYLHSAERFWQMEFTRRLLSGRMAEIAGDLPLKWEKFTYLMKDMKLSDLDYFMRIMGFDRSAKASYDQISPRTKELLQLYSIGVNSFLRLGKKSLPLELKLLKYQPESWSPIDTLLIAKGMHFEMNFSWRIKMAMFLISQKIDSPEFDIKELFPYYTPDLPTILRLDIEGKDLPLKELIALDSSYRAFAGVSPQGQGSNNWVVDGTMTTSGKVMLANDPHIMNRQPNVWYEVHLKSPEIELAGVTLPGAPAVIIGRNRHIAWGITNVSLDDTDLYLEELSDEDDGFYKIEGKWEPIQIIQTKINIKGKAPIDKKIRITRHGPLISDVIEKAKGKYHLAICWTGHLPSREADGFYSINLAKNWEEFRQGCSMIIGPGCNFVYGDVEGNIGYQTTGLVPIRKKRNGLLPAPGWSGEYDWNGFVPFEQMPRIYNPETHYIATANNKTIDDNYPFYISDIWEPPHRVMRLHTLIPSLAPHNAETFREIQLDVMDYNAMDLMPNVLEPVIRRMNLNNQIDELARKVFLDWDYHTHKESVGACIYNVMWKFLVEEVFLPFIGRDVADLYFELSQIIVLPLNRILKSEKSFFLQSREKQRIIERAFLRSLTFLRFRFGDDVSRWEWGNLHKVEMMHSLDAHPIARFIFNLGPQPCSGNMTTLNLGFYTFRDSYQAITSPSYRMIIDFSEEGISKSVIPSGQSGFPFSKHYRDQFKLWLKGEYHPFPMSSEKPTIKRTIILSPMAI